MEKSEYMTALLKKIGAVPIEQAFPHANLNVLPKTSAEPLMPEVKPCKPIGMTNEEAFTYISDIISQLSDKPNHIYALVMSAKALKREQWIPCSERLPDEHESILAERYGTDNWRKWMWRNTSDMVIATIQLENGGKSVRQAWTHDGKWYVDSILNVIVVAWMPLPEPYKEND